MNIVRALDVALPELPQRLVRQSPPKLDPKVIAKEHIENGQAVVLVKMPGTDMVFRFPPAQWQLVQLFDGDRSHAEVAAIYQDQTNITISEADVRELANYLQSESQLFYKSPLEKNIILQEELRSTHKKKRSRFQITDFSDITIKVWNNADGYVTRLYPKVKFIFTPTFVWLSLGMFVLMGWMWADRFDEIWWDSFAFYNFTTKSGRDLLEFWFLFGAMAGFHETAHGLAGKHYGATIERMGFTLMYFAPSFFCDATQVWVLGGKWARIVTAVAGIWLDLVLCFFATVAWWATAPGMLVHDWAYKVMIVTGIGVSLLNLNPLIKLDGYLIFSELVHEPALKESSTEYLSGWIRNRIFRLPAAVPYVPRRKRPFYVAYAILSGLYSYALLSFLMVFTYHVLQSYTPEWAFVPAVAIGCWVFRSRIKLAGKFMRLVYLDKKERARAWFAPGRIALLSAAAILLLGLPIFPDFVHGPCLLEPVRLALLRATIPGTVVGVLAQEGQHVAAGASLVRMRNSALESEVAHTQAELAAAEARAVQASIHYAGFAAAEQNRRQLVEKNRLLADQARQLTIVSPISGIVQTPRTADLVGSSPDAGQPLLEVADTSQMRARIFIPEFAMRDIRLGAPVRILARGQARPLTGVLAAVSADAAAIPEGLISKDQLQGIKAPRFYMGSVFLSNDDNLLDGTSGFAKIFIRRRSLAEFSWRFASDLVGRKVW